MEGVYLQITKGGSKSRIFRHRFKGYTSRGLGSIDTWKLAETGKRARLQRQLLDEGKDPIEVQKRK